MYNTKHRYVLKLKYKVDDEILISVKYMCGVYLTILAKLKDKLP